MAEADQNFVENMEQQNYDMQEFEHHHLGINDFDQQHAAEVVPGEYNYAINESDNQGLGGNEQAFIGNETENNFGDEQNYPHNESGQQAVGEDQGDQGIDGNEMKQEFEHTEVTETDNVAGDEKKVDHENNVSSGGEEKKWPGWPGESVFRMLVPVQKVGNIIGRKGEYIKKMVEETRARIKILDGPPGSQERAVLT